MPPVPQTHQLARLPCQYPSISSALNINPSTAKPQDAIDASYPFKNVNYPFIHTAMASPLYPTPMPPSNSWMSTRTCFPLALPSSQRPSPMPKAKSLRRPRDTRRLTGRLGRCPVSSATGHPKIVKALNEAVSTRISPCESARLGY